MAYAIFKSKKLPIEATGAHALTMTEVFNYVSLIQAYLSLPHGTASAAGLIAMVTDHYINLVRIIYIRQLLHL